MYENGLKSCDTARQQQDITQVHFNMQYYYCTVFPLFVGIKQNRRIYNNIMYIIFVAPIPRGIEERTNRQLSGVPVVCVCKSL